MTQDDPVRDGDRGGERGGDGGAVEERAGEVGAGRGGERGDARGATRGERGSGTATAAVTDVILCDGLDRCVRDWRAIGVMMIDCA